MEKFTKTNAERYIKNNNDAQVAQLGHLNKIIEKLPNYKSYVAVINQTGTNAPTASVLVNTLGEDVVWSRTNVGQYQATCSSFTFDKTFCTQFPALQFENASTFIPISINGNPQTGWINAYIISSPEQIVLDTYDMVGREEWSVIFGSSFYLEIRVYP